MYLQIVLPSPHQTMPPPRRKLQETVEATLTPPDTLASSQSIARVIKAEGNNLYSVELPSAKTLLVELLPRFRSTIWLKRGGFVVIDTKALADRDNKLDGEIVNVVRDERQWRKESYWPKEFVKKPAAMGSDSEEVSTVGKMPPSDDEDEKERANDEEDFGELG
jgi:probable RNA-binding protein EIF1AD